MSGIEAIVEVIKVQVARFRPQDRVVINLGRDITLDELHDMKTQIEAAGFDPDRFLIVAGADSITIVEGAE